MPTTSLSATAIAFSNLAFTKYSRSQSRYADRAGCIGWDARAGKANFIVRNFIFTTLRIGLSSQCSGELNAKHRLRLPEYSELA